VEHPNATIVRRGFEAFRTFDLTTLGTLFTDDIVWHSAGRNWLVGDAHGVPAILARFQAIVKYTEGTYRIEICDLLANDRRVVVLMRTSARRGDGHRIDLKAVAVFEVRGGDKIREVWTWPYDLYAEDEFYDQQPPPETAQHSAVQT
jgi:uncharacterized protein